MIPRRIHKCRALPRQRLSGKESVISIARTQSRNQDQDDRQKNEAIQVDGDRGESDLILVRTPLTRSSQFFQMISYGFWIHDRRLVRQHRVGSSENWSSFLSPAPILPASGLWITVAGRDLWWLSSRCWAHPQNMPLWAGSLSNVLQTEKCSILLV